MRTIIRKGLAFVVLCLLSAQAFGDIIDCDEQLKPVKELKPLYGLCVAFWSAGADESLPLLDLYREKAAKLADKYPDLDVPLDPPGLRLATCPCWDIGLLRELLARECWTRSDMSGASVSLDSWVAFYDAANGVDFVAFMTSPLEGSESGMCSSNGSDDSVLQTMILDNYVPVSGDSLEACRDDVIGLIDSQPITANASCDELN